MPAVAKVNPKALRIASMIGELPASPAIISAVMGLTSDLDSNVADISRVLASDQSLTAKVLKLSNSSFYGRSKEVKSLQEAILILGFFTVRSIVIATSTHRLYSTSRAEAPQSKLWRHTLSTAIASRQIAEHLGHVAKEEIFIGALLHDIGKLVMIQHLYDEYADVIASVEGRHRAFVEAETEQLGFTHCDVAGILLEKWSFPSSLTDAIRTHHNLPPCDPDRPVPLSYLISLGNQMAKNLGVGFDDRRSGDLMAEPAAVALGLDRLTLELLQEQVQQHYQSEVRIFEEA